MTVHIPEIRFKYGWLVAESASYVLNDAWGDGTPLRDFNEYEAIAAKYEAWWQDDGKSILRAMCNALDLQFKQERIDVYVVPWFNAISDPMILGPAFKSQDELVNTLTHELLHRLLTDNTAVPFDHDFVTSWQKLLGDLPFNTLVHVPVHAVMKKLYLEDIDRSDLFELDVRLTADNEPYAQAWKYVDEHGYENILEKFKDWYRSFAK